MSSVSALIMSLALTGLIVTTISKEKHIAVYFAFGVLFSIIVVTTLSISDNLYRKNAYR